MDYSDYYEKKMFPTTSLSDDRKGWSIRSFIFLCTVIILVGSGLITLYSASYDEALRMGLSGSYFFKRQLIFALMGFIAFGVISIIPIRWIRLAVYPLLGVSIILMLLTIFTPLGVEKMGARRWIQIGPLPSFQPSELIKISVILVLASLYDSQKTPSKKIVQRILLPLAVIIISAALIIAQKDYSTALVFVTVSLAVAIVGGLSFYLFLLIAGVLAVPATIFILIEPYRIRRIVSFLFPSIDPTGLNWQVSKSIEAIKSGRFLGKGLGLGTYKLGVIPEVHSDFIFASFGEEMGLVGIIGLVLLFSIFVIIGGKLVLENMDSHRFIAFAALGITLMIIGQAIVNIAVVTSLLPPTGIPLPFFSQGGTNLFVVISECGLLYRFMKGGN
jgi:cell division protein FtsW